jgi:hypothetical protein
MHESEQEEALHPEEEEPLHPHQRLLQVQRPLPLTLRVPVEVVEGLL